MAVLNAIVVNRSANHTGWAPKHVQRGSLTIVDWAPCTSPRRTGWQLIVVQKFCLRFVASNSCSGHTMHTAQHANVRLCLQCGGATDGSGLDMHSSSYAFILLLTPFRNCCSDAAVLFCIAHCTSVRVAVRSLTFLLSHLDQFTLKLHRWQNFDARDAALGLPLWARRRHR